MNLERQEKIRQKLEALELQTQEAITQRKSETMLMKPSAAPRVSLASLTGPSTRPPGDKFEWRHLRQKQWVDDPALWTRTFSQGPLELAYSLEQGLHLPDLEVDDFTWGHWIDVDLSDVRIVAKWNPGNEQMGSINDAAFSVILRQSPGASKYLEYSVFFDTYGVNGGDDLNIYAHPYDDGVQGFSYFYKDPVGNYDGTGNFGTDDDRGGNVWLYEPTITGVRPNADYWFVAQIVGDVLTIEHWLTDPELGSGTPMAGGTIAMKAPVAPPPTLLRTINGLDFYTTDRRASGGPTTYTIDGTEDLYTDPIGVIGTHVADAHVLTSVGTVAPTFSIKNLNTTQLRWRVYNAAGSSSGMPNGVASAGATSSFNLSAQGPGQYFLVIAFDTAPHTGSYQLTTGPSFQLVGPDPSGPSASDDIDWRPRLGAGVSGAVGLGYVQPAGLNTHGIREFRVFDLAGGQKVEVFPP